MSEHIETRAVHAGVKPDPTTGAIMTPIYATSTFVQESPGHHKGFDYTRAGNPTRQCLEKALADIEGARYGLAMSSGCAGTDAVMHLLDAGDHVVCCDDVYGGTHRLLNTVWSRHGIETTFVDMTQDSVADAIRPNTKLVWLETPTNPLLKVIDIQKIAAEAKRAQPDVIIGADNTFATPYFQRPLELGADIVLHSTTKYLNGHSDVVGGVLVTNRQDLYERLYHVYLSAGAGQAPMESWLVLRGLKTLALRMERHQENALEIAKFLEAHPQVDRVLYPGLPSHPQHAIAAQQMRGFGGMVTFFIKGKLEHARRFLESVQLMALAESLGGVESLIEHPAIMTHASVPPEIREKLGISDTLIRISVGIEHIEDLKADLDRALNAAHSA